MVDLNLCFDFTDEAGLFCIAMFYLMVISINLSYKFGDINLDDDEAYPFDLAPEMSTEDEPLLMKLSKKKSKEKKMGKKEADEV